MSKTITKTLRIKTPAEYNAAERGLTNYVKAVSDKLKSLKQADERCTGPSIENYTERIKAAKSLLKQLRDY